MVSTRPLISKSSCPFNNPLMIVPRVPFTSGIIVTFMFLIFFNSLARSRYLSFFSLSFNLTLFLSILHCRYTAKFTIFQGLFLLLMIIRSGRLSEFRWSVCMSKSQRSLCIILQDGCWVVQIPFLRMVKLKWLAQFPVYQFAHPVVSCLILFLC